MLQANVLRVGLLTSGALAIRSLRLVPDVSTARFGGFRKTIIGTGWRGRAHCWVLRKRAPRPCAGLVFVSSGRLGSVPPGWWGGFWRAGRSGLHTVSCRLFCGWWGVGGGCGLVSVRVLRTA